MQTPVILAALFAGGALLNRHGIRTGLQRLQHPHASHSAREVIRLFAAQAVSEDDQPLLTLCHAYDDSKRSYGRCPDSKDLPSEKPLRKQEVLDSLLAASISDNLELFHYVAGSYNPTDGIRLFLQDSDILCSAVAHKSIGVLQYLFDLGVQVSERENKSTTSLLEMALGNFDYLEPDAIYGDKSVVKSDLCNAQHRRVFQTLLVAGGHPGDCNTGGDTVFHIIAEQDIWEAFEDCVQCLDPIIIRSGLRIGNAEGLPALQVAALNSSTKTFDLMRSFDPTLAQNVSEQRTLLHYACQGIGTSTTILHQLLGEGASVLALAEDGSTVVHDCVMALEHQRWPYGFHDLAAINFTLAINELVRRGCDVACPRFDRKTPLHLLCDQLAAKTPCSCEVLCGQCQARLNCAQSLLDHMPAVENLDNEGKTVLHILMENLIGRPPSSTICPQDQLSVHLFMQVLDRLSSPDIRRLRCGEISALAVAAKTGNQQLLSRLLEIDSDVDVAYDFGNETRTPLQILCCSRTTTLSTFKQALGHSRDLQKLDNLGYGLLHLATSSNMPDRPALINMLLDAGVPAEMTGNSRWTPLMYATSEGRVDSLRALLARGANPSTRDLYSWTPFTLACDVGNDDAVQLLFESKASWDFVKIRLRTKRLYRTKSMYSNYTFWQGPIQLAAVHGNPVLIRRLLDWKRDGFLRLESASGPSALWLCSFQGNAEAARIFIDGGYDVNTQEKHEQVSCLQIAARHGHVETMKVLLDAGCDIDAEDRVNRTALDHATNGKQAQAIALMKKQVRKCKNTDIDMTLKGSSQGQYWQHTTASKFVPEFVEELIKEGSLDEIKNLQPERIDLSKSFSCGHCTPIMLATSWDQTEIATHLLDQGSQFRGRTCARHVPDKAFAIDLLCYFSNRLPLVKRILEEQSHMKHLAAGKPGLLSLMTCLAASYGNVPTLLELLKHRAPGTPNGGASPHWQSPPEKPKLTICHQAVTSARSSDSNFTAALHAAVEADQHDVVSVLLAEGVDVDAENFDHATALHIAAGHGCKTCMELLLDHSANVHSFDEDGLTPARYACRNGNLLALDLLVSRGADLNERSYSRTGVMIEALLHDQLAIAQVLYQRGYTLREEEDYPSELVMLDSSPSSAAVTFILNVGPQFEAHNYLLNASTDGFSFLSFLERGFLKKLSLRTILGNFLYRLAREGMTIRESGVTALHILCAEGATQHLAWLVDAGALINIETQFRDTPLMYACQYGRLDVVKLLVRRGAIVWHTKGTTMFSGVKAAQRFPKIVRWIIVERFTEQLKLDGPAPSSMQSTPRAYLNLDVALETTYAPATAFGQVPWSTTEFIAHEDVDCFRKRTLAAMQLGPLICRGDRFGECIKQCDIQNMHEL